MVIALIALFVAMGGGAYATHAGSVARDKVHSYAIINDAVTTADIQGGGGRGGTIKNRDVHPLLAVAKGFATVAARNTNGPAAVQNFGGQQTRTEPAGVSAQRVFPGIYEVTFAANVGTGKFINVDSFDDLAIQVTGRNGFSIGAATPAGSTASEDQVKLRIIMRRPDNGGLTDAPFTVQFYARTVG
jgi:hypothetical protein